MFLITDFSINILEATAQFLIEVIAFDEPLRTGSEVTRGFARAEPEIENGFFAAV